MQLWQTTCKSDEAKERKLYFYRGDWESGRGCYKKEVHWKILGRVQSTVAFHWPSCDSLSLAELLPGKEKIFLPPAGGGKVVSLPARDARYTSFCWNLYYYFFLIFIYLHWPLVVAGSLVAARGLLSCGMQTLSRGMHVGSSSLTRDRTWVPYIGSTES